MFLIVMLMIDNEGVAAMGVKYFAEERILGSRGYDVGVFW